MWRAKRTTKKFDPVKIVLPLKFKSLGCPMLTLRTETLLYMSTPQRDVYVLTFNMFIFPSQLNKRVGGKGLKTGMVMKPKRNDVSRERRTAAVIVT